MNVYIPEMFDVEKIEVFAADLLLKRETCEFQLNVFQTNLDKFKKENFKDILIFERMRDKNPKLIPDKSILKQMKIVESDPSVKNFKQTISKLKREIKNINTMIENVRIKIGKMFKFDDIDVMKYLNGLLAYQEGVSTFDELMEMIFKNEFNNKKMYYEVAGLRNYKVLSLLHDKAPQKWKKIMALILDETRYTFIKEEFKLIEEFDIIQNNEFDVPKLAILVQAKYKIKMEMV